MKRFSNAYLEPANITMKVNLKTFYKCYGFCMQEKDEKLGECLALYPATAERPVAIVPQKDVVEVIYEY